MLNEALLFLIQSVGGFFAGILLLRFWMQWCRAPIRNPLSEFVQALTNFAVLPARRLVPGLWGMDLSSLVLAWVVVVIEAVLTLAVKGVLPVSGTVLGVVVLLSLVMLLRLAVYLAIGSIIMMVIISWVNPASPMYSLINTLTRPLLRPIQRLVPPIGMVDLSPLIALLLLQLILMVPLVYLERMIGALL
ncbi:MAG: YggT family protein [Burkholderiales bacterium]